MIIEKAEITEQKRLADNVFSTVLRTGIAKHSKPGQFVMVGSGSEAHLLRRPISICGADGDKGTLRLVYRTVGYGTVELSERKSGERVDLMGPLGNGFPAERAVEMATGQTSEKITDQTSDNTAEKSRILLIAGGIGAPPLLFLSGYLRKAGVKKEDITAALGYGSALPGLFLREEFEENAKTIIATDDGSAGFKGRVVDAAAGNNLTPDIIFACGPYPMLKAVKEFALRTGAEAYISLEERMACGVGACLGCVTKTLKPDSHSLVNNARVCKEGPVFNACEVEL